MKMTRLTPKGMCETNKKLVNAIPLAFDRDNSDYPHERPFPETGSFHTALQKQRDHVSSCEDCKAWGFFYEVAK
jgi:hypothetical protein